MRKTREKGQRKREAGMADSYEEEAIEKLEDYVRKLEVSINDNTIAIVALRGLLKPYSLVLN